MKRNPEFCQKCYQGLKPGKYIPGYWEGKEYVQGKTFCGHLNQAKTVTGAINLVLHGGELPCSYNPIRNEFFEELGKVRREGWKI